MRHVDIRKRLSAFICIIRTPGGIFLDRSNDSLLFIALRVSISRCILDYRDRGYSGSYVFSFLF